MLLLLFVDFFNKLLPTVWSVIMMDTLYKRSAYKSPGNNFVRETTETHQFKLYLVFVISLDTTATAAARSCFSVQKKGN